MTNCFHYNQPAIARVGAKQKFCAVSSPLVKERLWAWDFNNERDGANWQVLQSSPHFPLLPKCVLIVLRREGHFQQRVPQGRSWRRWLGHRLVLLSFRQGTSSGPWVGLRGTVEAWLPVSLSSEPGLTLGAHLCLLAMNSGETV